MKIMNEATLLYMPNRNGMKSVANTGITDSVSKAIWKKKKHSSVGK